MDLPFRKCRSGEQMGPSSPLVPAESTANRPRSNNLTASSERRGLRIALQERVGPSCRKERYQAQFQARLKKKDEGWADLADGYRNQAQKAYPELEDTAKEQLALNHFLSQIETHMSF